MAPTLTTGRLTLRPRTLHDVDAALAFYGHPDVARWWSPATDVVGDQQSMRLLLQHCIAEDQRAVPPTGRWALDHPGVEELFAVARPANTRGAATAKRIGMEWVGESDKYYDLRLWGYRLRAADLDHPLPGDNDVDQHHQADSPEARGRL